MQEEMHRTLEKRTIRRKSSCKNGRKYKKDINYGSLYENVFSDENIQVKDNVFYCPVYLVGMFKKQVAEEDLIYQLDLGILQ